MRRWKGIKENGMKSVGGDERGKGEKRRGIALLLNNGSRWT
jgi:hypothetical protein